MTPADWQWKHDPAGFEAGELTGYVSRGTYFASAPIDHDHPLVARLQALRDDLTGGPPGLLLGPIAAMALIRLTQEAAPLISDSGGAVACVFQAGEDLDVLAGSFAAGQLVAALTGESAAVAAHRDLAGCEDPATLAPDCVAARVAALMAVAVSDENDRLLSELEGLLRQPEAHEGPPRPTNVGDLAVAMGQVVAAQRAGRWES